MECQEFGKTTFISILAKLIQNRKILVIDFDLKDNCLHSVFGVKQIPSNMKNKIKDTEYLTEFRLKEKNIDKLIVKVDRNIRLISSTKIIFNNKYKCDKFGVKQMLEELIQNYRLILIDTSSDTKYEELTKILTSLSNKIICLIEGNLMTLKKNMRLLKEFDNEKKKISLIYNKKNSYTLSTKIMRILFLKYRIKGIISYDNQYTNIINKNVKKSIISRNIKREFKKIIEKLQIN